jgi:hypothetical protein
MLRKIATSALGAGAAVLVLGAPAHATGPWTVTGPAAGSTVTATSTDIVFTDVTAGITASCTSGAANGKLAANSGTWDSDPIVTNLAITTSGCTGIGITFNLTQNGTATLHATGPTVGGVTPGEIRGISVKGTALGGLCTVQVDGPGGANSKTGVITGTYDNSGVITATGAPNITVASASLGCNIGGIKKGDKASLSGTFNVTSSPVPVVNAS